MVWCKAYFDILNRLGVTHESNRQTGGQADQQTVAWQMPRFITLRGQKLTRSFGT